MNQQRSGRYYYSEEFEKRRLPRWIWLVILLAIVASYVAAAVIGAIVWEQQTHASARARATHQPAVRLVVAQPAAMNCTPWQCTAKDFAEHRQACKDRAVIALTKPKE